MTLKSMFAAVLVVVAGTMPASAACIQSNIAGTWSTAITSTFQEVSIAFVCELAISASGKIRDVTCTAQATNNFNSVVTSLSQGSIRLSDAKKCLFTGRITLGTALPNVFLGALSKEKSYFEGVGSQPSGFGFLNIRLLKQ